MCDENGLRSCGKYKLGRRSWGASLRPLCFVSTSPVSNFIHPHWVSEAQQVPSTPIQNVVFYTTPLTSEILSNPHGSVFELSHSCLEPLRPPSQSTQKHKITVSPLTNGVETWQGALQTAPDKALYPKWSGHQSPWRWWEGKRRRAGAWVLICTVSRSPQTSLPHVNRTIPSVSLTDPSGDDTSQAPKASKAPATVLAQILPLNEGLKMVLSFSLER